MKTWHARAKLNLFLHIVGRYDDGYHELQTVFHLIDWYDELKFSVTSSGQIRRISETPGIRETEDLAIRAATALRRRCPGEEGADIHLAKSIPVGSGLGGGSSDAAVTLVALNELWRLNLSTRELMKIGAELGADVPVFVRGENAWGEGRGDRLSIISIPEQLYLVVVPPVSVSTKLIYDACNFQSYRNRVSKNDFSYSDAVNDLAPVVCKMYSEVEAALNWLSQFGESRVTGSGGAVFARLKSERQGELALAQIPSGYRAKICRGMAS